MTRLQSIVGWLKAKASKCASFIERFWPSIAIALVVIEGIAVSISLHEQHSLSIKNRALVLSIQQSRVTITRANCVDQNRRHHKVIARFYRQIGQTPGSGPGRAAGITYNRDLINEILPSKNCPKVVKRAVVKQLPIAHR